MRDTTPIEKEQQPRYPGLTVRRDGLTVVVHIPMRFVRRNGRMIVLTEGEGATEADPQRTANNTLLEAIAKAHLWQDQIEAGEYASMEDLARELGVNRSYVGRMLRLTSLAPDIVAAIVEGNEPQGISLEKLRKEMPVRWEEQRRKCAINE